MRPLDLSAYAHGRLGRYKGGVGKIWLVPMVNQLAKYARLARSHWRGGGHAHASFDRWCSRIRTYLLTSLVVLSVAPQGLNAAPESWVNPTHTFTGNPGSGFGSAVSCSSVVSELGQSYFAVGAPQEDGGRVHIYGPSGLVQTLSGTGGEFGYAVTFVTDINGDGIDELLVGEPYSFTAPASGSIYMYLSTENLAAPYASCGSKLGVVGFGIHVLSMSTPVLGGVRIVVGNPDISHIDSFNVFHAAGVCLFEETSEYTGSMSGGRRYGQSIGEIFEHDVVLSRLIVGAPGDGFDPDIEGCSPSGSVYSKYPVPPPAPILLGSSSCSGEKFGTAIAANANSALIAFLAPRELAGQTLYVRQQVYPLRMFLIAEEHAGNMSR